MDIPTNTVKNLLLNPEFRKWVLQPNPESSMIWEKYLIDNPTLNKDVELAREILLELFSDQYPMQDNEYKEIWDFIDKNTKEEMITPIDKKIIPINPHSNIQASGGRPFSQLSTILKIAAVLLIVLGLGVAVKTLIPAETVTSPTESISFEEFTTPPGVKSSITLGDGSKVLLNSGSSLRFVKGFGVDEREVFLTGEAFFEVSRDSIRPFTVITGEISTTALGTSFNIEAYKDENLNISLLTGKVAVEVPYKRQGVILLEEEEKLHIPLEDGNISKVPFNEEEVVGWTRKMIVFEKTELAEAIRKLENWYGTTFNFMNQPKPGLYLSGKFYNETLENVLQGLSHTARLDYEIKGDTVNITFKN